LLTIDYGLTAEEWLSPERKEGTVRAYSRHHVNREVLANPGQQDLTAHVNFSAIRAVGEAAGLKTDLWQSQSQFLTAIGTRAWLPGAAFGEWTSARTRQFQTLVHPEHLGRSFRVLVQKR
jgi:SAM-dependent MidA family methyltransferase